MESSWMIYFRCLNKISEIYRSRARDESIIEIIFVMRFHKGTSGSCSPLMRLSPEYLVCYLLKVQKKNLYDVFGNFKTLSSLTHQTCNPAKAEVLWLDNLWITKFPHKDFVLKNQEKIFTSKKKRRERKIFLPAVVHSFI